MNEGHFPILPPLPPPEELYPFVNALSSFSGVDMTLNGGELDRYANTAGRNRRHKRVSDKAAGQIGALIPQIADNLASLIGTKRPLHDTGTLTGTISSTCVLTLRVKFRLRFRSQPVGKHTRHLAVLNRQIVHKTATSRHDFPTACRRPREKLSAHITRPTASARRLNITSPVGCLASTTS